MQAYISIIYFLTVLWSWNNQNIPGSVVWPLFGTWVFAIFSQCFTITFLWHHQQPFRFCFVAGFFVPASSLQSFVGITESEGLGHKLDNLSPMRSMLRKGKVGVSASRYGRKNFSFFCLSPFFFLSFTLLVILSFPLSLSLSLPLSLPLSLSRIFTSLRS